MNDHPTTNVELIFRLANKEDQQAWSEFVEIYEPLILRAARRLGLSSNDASDATQEVLVHLASVVSKWNPGARKGSFRGWLIRVARNQMLKLAERTTMFKSESGGEEAQSLLRWDLDDQFEQSSYFNIEFRRQAFLFVVKKIRKAFNETTWQAFWKTYIDEQPPQHAADELGISVGAVYIARSRVMNKLQTEIRILVDDEWESLLSDDVSENSCPELPEIRDASTAK